MKIRSHFFLLTLVATALWGCEKEGPAGKNSLIVQLPEPASEQCLTGGLRIISGLDANGNNLLDSNEIQNTNIICNPTDIYNKETIINFQTGVGLSSTSVTGQMYDFTAIHNFDIANYPADSISFSVVFGTNDATVPAFVELYDQTNNKVIANTTLSSTLNAEPKTTTVNILKDLPKGPVTLNFRIRTSASPNFALVTLQSAALKIYKR